MIQFSCHCGHRFSVDDDQAGGDVQCPDCGLLNDIPHLDDLPNLAADGTFRVADPLPREPGRTGELLHLYQRRHFDHAGEPIDLRNRPGDAADAIGGQPTDIDPARPSRINAPRYDPETGELIRAIDVRDGYAYAEAEQAQPVVGDSSPQAVIPFAKPAIGYGRQAERFGPANGLMLELFQMANAIVMASVVVAHLLGGFMHLFIVFICAAVSSASDFYLPPWPFNLLFWLVVAHYGNALRALAVEEADELPRPLGSLELFDEILLPLGRALLAIVLCYWPAFWIASTGEGPRLLLLPALLAGGYLFPAVAMATLLGGSLDNLSPRRLRAVILACGKGYRRTAALWAGLFPAYLLVALGVDLIGPIFGADLLGVKYLGKLVIALPLLLTCVYLMHLFVWRLALLYRRGHRNFGWAWEEHQQAIEAARAERQRAGK